MGNQQPFAIILGCSDSRVPAEMVFDQGHGDLFVIRVAGNIVAPSQIGSVKFAAEWFGTQLVVVLGYCWCGVVSAILKDLTQQTTHRSQKLRSMEDRVRTSVEPMLATEFRLVPDVLLHQAVRVNIHASANHLRHGSEILESLIQQGKLLIVRCRVFTGDRGC